MLYTLILAFALTTVRTLVPQYADEDRIALSEAFAEVLSSEEPLFREDPLRLRTASVVLAVAFREGSLRNRVDGDCADSKSGEPCKGAPRSFCTMQVHRTSGGTQALNEDLGACFRAGMALLRQSFKVCPSHPIAWYAAGGTKACGNARARRISDDRMALAKRLYKSAQEEL